eukprot:CFRG0747T1
MSSENILTRIYASRRNDLEITRQTVTEEYLRSLIDNPASSFKCLNFAERLRKGKREHRMACIAEVKRASPSKGDFSPNADAADQAYRYAQGGADGISVLTEPHYFKGQLADLRAVRAMLETTTTNEERPCVLRKDFIFDPFQLLEARAYGADSVLLIVKMLSDVELSALLKASRELGMEPLVEVNNTEEMTRALTAGAVVIGVNNRNLTDFRVDLTTTSSLLAMVPDDVIIMALSGISCRADVARYEEQGVRAILVGESLMRAPDAGIFLQTLLGDTTVDRQKTIDQTSCIRTRAKVCGLSSVEAALAAARAGADMCGLIFAEKSPRKVSIEMADLIVREVKLAMGHVPGSSVDIITDTTTKSTSSSQLDALLNIKRPLFVGVFQNQPLEFVNRVVTEANLDIVQLHGAEDSSFANEVCVPCVRVVHVSKNDKLADILEALTSAIESDNVVLTLLDTKVAGASCSGGAGVVFDWELASAAVKSGRRLMMAGGLTPENVREAVNRVSPFAVDVSSGVETDKVKDTDKIRRFVQQVSRL